MQKTWVPSLGRKNPLEKGMATHSSILAWRILWTEEQSRLQSMGSQRVGCDCETNFHVICQYESTPFECELWWIYNQVTSACNVGDLGSIPGLGRSSGEGKGYPLQHSGLENSMDCTVCGVAKSRTRLSAFHLHPLPQHNGALFFYPRRFPLVPLASVLPLWPPTLLTAGLFSDL